MSTWKRPEGYVPHVTCWKKELEDLLECTLDFMIEARGAEAERMILRYRIAEIEERLGRRPQRRSPKKTVDSRNDNVIQGELC